MEVDGYDHSDPKSASYYDRMAELWDNRDKTQVNTRDLEEAHAEGLHDEVPREFCPLCKSRA